ncbi:MAG: PAQR family membrane homeostasis protein TrhA [Christensenellales bacterium]|jgi:hemolysin III
MDKIHLYSEREEALNTLSHFVSALIALAGVIIMLIKVYDREPVIVGVMTFYTLTTFAVYLFSTVYHGTKDIKRKIFWQKIDHSMVSLIILGTAAPALTIVASGVFAWIMLGLVVLVTGVNIALNMISVYKFKRYSLPLYALGAIFIALGLVIDIKIINQGFIILMLISLVVIVAGSCLYMAKSRQYTHFIWHITDITCSVLHFLAFYLYIV